MEITYGECVMLGKHKGCSCGGKVMKCSPHIINGRVFPISETHGEWEWCNGRKWVKVGGAFVWQFCGQTTRKGDVLEVER